MFRFNKLRETALARKILRPSYRFGKYLLVRVALAADPPSPSLLSPTRVTPMGSHCFFGYYDKSPWSANGRYLLCHQTPFARRMARPGEKADICVVDLENGNRMRAIGATSAWSWQQGAMLQWAPLGQERVLYNDFRDGEYVSVICDLSGKLLHVFPKPTSCVSPREACFLTGHYDRLNYCRPGYGYVATPFTRTKDLHPDDEGIFRVDMLSGKADLLVSLGHLASLDPRSDFNESIHHCICMAYNPSGARFAFYHRWRNLETRVEKTRLYTAASDGSDLYCLWDHDLVSHYTWKDDEHLLVWAENALGEQGYYLIKDESPQFTRLGDGILTEDGHPSYSPNGRWLLTDTYPDAKRRRTLLLYDTETEERYDIVNCFVPFLFDEEIRCDLHPRWSKDGHQVCFDSVHEGFRGVYTVDVSDIVAPREAPHGGCM